jgi:acetolactate synthase-1/2/3 large subunit
MAHIGDLVAETLARYGTTHVFGLPGGQTAALYDGIARRAPRIQHVLVRDERSAGYAADAYARLTGRPGVCDVTVGPGTTKLSDGLAEARNASIPVIALVGELPRDWAPLRDMGVASQGFDQIPFLRSITKMTWAVPSEKALPHLIRAAYRTAASGRPGPVALVIPHVDDRYTTVPAHRPYASPDEVESAAALLARSQRPAIVAGGGVLVSRAAEELRCLAERVDALVATSFSGKGAVAEGTPYAGGVLNPLGSQEASQLVEKADVLVWCGCKVGQNTSLNWTLPRPEQATIQVDIDPAELGRTFRPTVALNGDVKGTLAALLDELEPRDHPEWLEEIADVKAEAEEERVEEAASDEAPLVPPRVMHALAERIEPSAVVISDASFAAGWIAAYLPVLAPGRNFLFARGLGGLGYAVPAALGAAAARPDGRIVTINGDGGISYAVGELANHAAQGLRTVNIVLNNGTLGWLQMWQELFFEDLRQSVDLESEDAQPDFAAAAKALGCSGFRVEAPEELSEALDDAFSAAGPAVVDIRVEPRATPIHSYRERLAEGKTFDRPGTELELRPWTRSAEASSIGTESPEEELPESQRGAHA